MRHSNGLLQGKVAIVTGGGAGIGEAIAKLFALHGAKVLVNGLPGDPAADVAREIMDNGGTAQAFLGDVATAAGAKECVARALQAFGRLDVLVCNAGIFPEYVELGDFPDERFDELLHANIKSVYCPVRAALPALRESRGVILAAGSEAGLRGFEHGVSYGATKGWVMSFIRGVAAEQAKYGVRANVVAPGPIDTEMTRPSKGKITAKGAFLAVETVPLGRRGTPEEVANVYLFLASDLASYVTGATYTVDGGATCTIGIPGLMAQRAVRKQPEGELKLQHQFAGRGVLR